MLLALLASTRSGPPSSSKLSAKHARPPARPLPLSQHAARSRCPRSNTQQSSQRRQLAMASSLNNALRGGETGGTINRILSNSRYLNNGGRQSFLGTSTATSFSLGKLEHAKLLQSALNGRMKGHTVPQQMAPPGGAPTYCWNDECSSGVEGESYYGTSLLQLGEHGRPYCHNCIAENPTLVEPPNSRPGSQEEPDPERK